MADEKEVTSTTQEAPTTTTETVVQEQQVDPRDAELAAARERLTRYEQMVVSPEYAEFLATKTAEKVAQQQGTAPQEYSSEEKQAFVERLNNMSRAEFAAFVRDLTVDTVRQQLFAPVVNTIVTEKVQNQIAAAASKFPDYWDYRQDMINIANANPSLNAEQAYHLAKASRSPSAARSAPRRGGELPSSPPAARTEKPSDRFEDAFEKAFKKAGL